MEFDAFINKYHWNVKRSLNNNILLVKGTINVNLNLIYEKGNLLSIEILDLLSYSKKLSFNSLESQKIINELNEFSDEVGVDIYYFLDNLSFNSLEKVIEFMKNIGDFTFIYDGSFKLVHFGKYKMKYFAPLDTQIYNFISIHLDDFEDSTHPFLFEGFINYFEEIYLKNWNTVQALLVSLYAIKTMYEFYYNYYKDFFLMEKEYLESKKVLNYCEETFKLFKK